MPASTGRSDSTKFPDASGNPAAPWRLDLIMTQYRFVTPGRRGKWYDNIRDAQTFANAIGAGFLNSAGNFIAYRGTILELREKETAGTAQFLEA